MGIVQIERDIEKANHKIDHHKCKAWEHTTNAQFWQDDLERQQSMLIYALKNKDK